MEISDEIRGIIRQYFTDLTALVATFNFTRPGRDRSLGLDAAHIVGVGIIRRTQHDQCDADGAQFPPNDPRYDAMKSAKYHSTRIGVRTGQMLSLRSVLGKIELEPLLVKIHYGTGEPPEAEANPVFDADKKITDTKKAEYFTGKKGDWFEADEQIAGKVRDMFSSELDRFIDELNAKS